MADRFQILALDGGGTRGLFTANILARLEDDLGCRVGDHFDLVTGTSAGGIIALALGAGMRPREIVDAYKRLSRQVFPRRRRVTRSVRGMFGPMYSQRRFAAALDEIFGERKMSESSMRLAIPAWDAESGSVHVYKTPHASHLKRDGRLRMAEVGLATAAAPAFFSAARVDEQLLIDGGVWANNPSLVGLAEAVGSLGVPMEDVWILNIGTMDELRRFPRRLASGGWLAWAPRATGLVLRAGSRGGEGVVRLLLGKDRYVRADVQVPSGLFSLDGAAYKEMEARASGASRALSPVYAGVFGGHSRSTRGF